MRTPTAHLVAVAVLVGLAGGLALFGPAASAGDAGPAPAATVEVSATGVASADPDRAHLTVAVVATAEEASTAQARVAADATAMRDALRDAGVSDEQVRTVSYSLTPDYRDDDREAPRSRAVHRFRVTVTPLDRAGDVVDLVVANGADRVERVGFGLSPAAERDLRAAALADAMANARSQADAVAAAGGLSIRGVSAVSTGLRYGGPAYADVAGREGGATTTFDPGSVDVSATVGVTYDATA
jgi:uncharacterized protein YggE